MAAVLRLLACRPLAPGRSDHEGAILDGPRPQQHMPMRLAAVAVSVKAARRRESKSPCLGHLAVQKREADIVADAEPDLAPLRFGQGRGLAARHRARFPVGLPRRQIDIEEVDFGIARRDRALWIDQKRPVGGFAFADLDRQRADQKPDAQLFGEAFTKVPAAPDRASRRRTGPVWHRHPAPSKWCFPGVRDKGSPACHPPRGLQRRGVTDIGRHVFAGTHLDAGGAEFVIVFPVPPFKKVLLRRSCGSWQAPALAQSSSWPSGVPEISIEPTKFDPIMIGSPPGRAATISGLAARSSASKRLRLGPGLV